MKNEDKEVNHPSHYTYVPGVECIDITKHFDFLLGNVIKYIFRCGKKESSTRLKDLKKAQWYLNYAIKEEEYKQK
jgi:hypothetical protein